MSYAIIKLVVNPNRKIELGNQTYTKRCALYSRMQCPSLRVVASKTIELFSKNTCVGDIELYIWLQIFVVENFRNYTVITKNIIYENFVSIDNSRYYRHKVSLVSNNKFTQVFQLIVSVLHNLHLHHLCGVYRSRFRERTCRL